jgi:thymidine kinase
MSCELLLGGMMSGKTTELRRRLKVELDTGARVIYVNHVSDTRGDGSGISTHNSQLAYDRDGIPNIKTDKLEDIYETIKTYEVIGIDEGQFYSDINDTVRRLVVKDSKVVLIAALSGDYKMEIFGEVYKLLPICAAGQVTILGGRCQHCLLKGKTRSECIGSFTSRLDASTSPINGNTEIGGSDKYITLCLECYKIHNYI